MPSAVQIIKFAFVLIAAATLGNWFLAELRSARAKGKPWYAAYLSIPGLLILLAVALPILLRLAR